jgi:metal-responsive CopG/Arc/MetJ family transcriptional regulator
MRTTVTTSLPREEIKELDRVCRNQGLTRAEAVRDAIRRYLSSPYLPAFFEDLMADEIDS